MKRGLRHFCIVVGLVLVILVMVAEASDEQVHPNATISLLIDTGFDQAGTSSVKIEVIKLENNQEMIVDKLCYDYNGTV